VCERKRGREEEEVCERKRRCVRGREGEEVCERKRGREEERKRRCVRVRRRKYTCLYEYIRRRLG